MFVVIKKTIKKVFHWYGYDITTTIPAESVDDLRGEEREFFGNIQVVEREMYERLCNHDVDKIHYGCGSTLLGVGWINIDLPLHCSEDTGFYLSANLVSRHPFPSDFFRYSFAEDFLEHLDQCQSLIFLSEAFRTLRQGGAFRLSFPGLRGVLRRHYRSSDYDGALVGKHEAYSMWGHNHFYCEESLTIVASHIGFSKIEFVDYGNSRHEDLRNLDSRPDQRDLNIYAELTK